MLVKEMNVQDLSARLAGDAEFELLDIRTREELAEGIISGASTLLLDVIPQHLQAFRDCEKDIVIYCRSGGRSTQVCAFLMEQGIENVMNLTGGIIAWAESGQQLVAPADGIGFIKNPS